MKSFEGDENYARQIIYPTEKILKNRHFYRLFFANFCFSLSTQFLGSLPYLSINSVNNLKANML